MLAPSSPKNKILIIFVSDLESEQKSSNIIMNKKYTILSLSAIAFLLFGIAAIYKYFLSPAHQEYIKTKPYYVDIINGTIDGLKPTATNEEIVAKFPDYTSIDETESVYNDGGGVFYINKGMFFYTYKDIIDIREDFIGNVSLNLMSKGTNEIPTLLKKDPIKIEGNSYTEYFGNSEPRTTHVVAQTFEMNYGKIMIESTPSKVIRLKLIHSK